MAREYCTMGVLIKAVANVRKVGDRSRFEKILPESLLTEKITDVNINQVIESLRIVCESKKDELALSIGLGENWREGIKGVKEFQMAIKARVSENTTAERLKQQIDFVLDLITAVRGLPYIRHRQIPEKT